MQKGNGIMSHAKLSVLVLVVFLALSCSVGAGKDRSYVSGNFSLTLDGANGGFLKNVEGGAISAEVINEPAGPSYFVKKHIGQPKYEEFTVQMGFSMSKVSYEWIRQSWAMKPQRMNGSIVAMDFKLEPKSERQFTNAMLTETTIPALDGASKEPAYLTIKFAPETIRTVKPAGKPDSAGYGKNEQKMFLPSNFKLEIDGIDCSKVNRIDSFTVKQKAVTDDIGEARDARKEPGKLEFPNLKITVSEAAAQPFLDWHESFVLKGNNDEKNEKGGSLTLFSPNRQEVLARIKFFNMGIFRVQPDKSEANADQIKRMQVELYVERMEFEYAPKEGSAGATGAKPAAVAPVPAAPGTLKTLR
jgi:phage tail-like protein